MKSVIHCWVLALLVSLAGSVGSAEEPAKLTAEQVIKNWMAASERLGACEVTFAQYEYDRVFEVVKVSKGVAKWVSPDRWRLEVSPLESEAVGPHFVSRGGVTYQMESGDSGISCRDGRNFAQAGSPIDMGLILSLRQQLQDDYPHADEFDDRIRCKNA